MYALLTFDIIKRFFFIHFIIRIFFRHRTNRRDYFVWLKYHFDIREWPFFSFFFFRNYPNIFFQELLKQQDYIGDFFFMIRKRCDIRFFTLYFTARALSQVASLCRGDHDRKFT